MQSSFDRGISFEMELASELCFRHNSRVLGSFRLYSKVLEDSSSIDLLIFSRKGLFVVEAKRFKTWLKGNVNDGYWVGASGRNGIKIYNVYFQNLLHLRLVKEFMRRRGLSAPRVFNVILVPDGCLVESDYEGAMTVSDFHAKYNSLADVWGEYVEVFKVFEEFQSTSFRRKDRRC